MAEYRLTPKAQHDLDNIFDHTSAKWGLDQAIRYVDLIEAACAELAEFPLRAPSCTQIRPGYRKRGVEQHVIFFQPTDYGVGIFRILHHSMDVSRHL